MTGAAIGLLAAAGYLVVKGMEPTPGAPAPAAPKGSLTTPATTTGPGQTTAQSSTSVLSKLKAALQAANVPQQGGDYVATPWQFDYFLQNATGLSVAQLSNNMGGLFPGCGTGVTGGCDTTQITLSQFWAAASSWLTQHGNLSGIGLWPVRQAGMSVRLPVVMGKGWR